MAFTGKACYSSGATLPESAEDLSDLVGIISPYETPLLSKLGDPIRSAETRSGTQCFGAGFKVLEADVEARKLGCADELDYQKQEGLRKLLRDLENAVINGKGFMIGIIPQIKTNIIRIGIEGLQAGPDLSSEILDFALRQIWENSSGHVDLIVVSGFQKLKINKFLATHKKVDVGSQTFCDLVDCYETNFGPCKIVADRWMPRDAVLLLDSSLLGVLPLKGKSFYYLPLPRKGDCEQGRISGEYALEMRNEESHGIIRGLSMD